MARRPHPAVVGFVRRYVLALGTAVVVLVTAIVAVNVAIDRRIDSIAVVDDLVLDDEGGAGEPANYLLIGSDSRDFVGDDPGLEEAFGNNTTDTGGQRSDTLLVVHVDPKAKRALLVSFPRDLKVNVPGHGAAKINAAYNYGGAQLVVDTLQANFDIPIHHYLEVNFLGFAGIVDAIGGVDMYVPGPARDLESGLEIGHFGPGCYTFFGDQALAFVRSRNYEEWIDGRFRDVDAVPDINRISRQQTFLKRLAATAVEQAGKSLTTASRVADEVLANLRVDPGFGRSDVNRLARAFRDIDVNDINSVEMTTVPWTAPTANDPRLGSVLLLKQPDADELFARLRDFGAEPVPPPDVQPREVRVRVYNGSGVRGAAAATSQALVAQGFQYGGIGDASSRRAQTEVRHRSASTAKAQLVLAHLGGVGRLVEDDAIVEADVLLVIGSDFRGVAPPGQTPSTTAPAGAAPGGGGASTTTTTTPPEADPQTEC